MHDINWNSIISLILKQVKSFKNKHSILLTITWKGITYLHIFCNTNLEVMSRGGLLTEELIDMITENDFDSTNYCDYCKMLTQVVMMTYFLQKNIRGKTWNVDRKLIITVITIVKLILSQRMLVLLILKLLTVK